MKTYTINNTWRIWRILNLGVIWQEVFLLIQNYLSKNDRFMGRFIVRLSPVCTGNHNHASSMWASSAVSTPKQENNSFSTQTARINTNSQI